ncbi:MAG: DUF5362 family protein [Ferruginibacter sp.]
METQNLLDTDLLIDPIAKTHLKDTAKWAKFLGIVGFIYGALIAIAAIFSGSLIAGMSGNYNRSSGGLMAGGGVAIVYLVFASVVFFMSYYLFRFAQKTQVALQTNDQPVLNESFKNLKIYFRLAGIVTIIAIVFSILAVIGIIFAATFTRG